MLAAPLHLERNGEKKEREASLSSESEVYTHTHTTHTHTQHTHTHNTHTHTTRTHTQHTHKQHTHTHTTRTKQDPGGVFLQFEHAWRCREITSLRKHSGQARCAGLTKSTLRLHSVPSPKKVNLVDQLRLPLHLSGVLLQAAPCSKLQV